MGRIRVLVADGQRMFAQALAAALDAYPDVEVVGEEPNTGIDAVAAVARHKPDVVVLDEWIGGMHGPAAVAAITAREPSCKVIVLSWFSPTRAPAPDSEAGADAVVGKDRSLADLVAATHWVAAQPSNAEAHRRQGDGRGPETLTKREIEVLELLGVGFRRDRIAETLSVSSGTVRIHIQNILAKLGARSQLEAIAIARGRSLLSPGRLGSTRAASPASPRPPTDGEAAAKVLVADAQLLFAETVGRALCRQPGLELAPEFPCSAEDVIDAAVRIRPDVVVLDHWLPGGDAAATIETLLARAPTARVILLSWLVGADHVRDGLMAGAAGFLPKQASLARLAQAVQQAARGAPLVLGSETAALVEALEDMVAAGDKARRRLKNLLTERETEILQLSGLGRSPDDIARSLGIRSATVKVHMRNIRCKLQVNSIAEAVAVAERCGFIPVL